jgi:hypothetical protein
MSFSLDLAAFAKNTNEKADAAIRGIVQAVDEAIVEKTPVGDPKLWVVNQGRAKGDLIKPKGYVGGRLRANWQYGLNVEPEGEIDVANNYVGYDDAKTTVSREMNKLEVGQGCGNIHYLANNLPYAERVESGTWSTQAPAGMVGITVIEFQSIVRRVVLETNYNWTTKFYGSSK